MWDGKIGKHNWIFQPESKTLLLSRAKLSAGYKLCVGWQHKTGPLQDFSSIYIRNWNFLFRRFYLYFNDTVIKLYGNIKCLVKAKCILIRGHHVSKECWSDISNDNNVKCQEQLEHKHGTLVSTVWQIVSIIAPRVKQKFQSISEFGHRMTLVGISPTICLVNNKY